MPFYLLAGNFSIEVPVKDLTAVLRSLPPSIFWVKCFRLVQVNELAQILCAPSRAQKRGGTPYGDFNEKSCQRFGHGFAITSA